MKYVKGILNKVSDLVFNPCKKDLFSRVLTISSLTFLFLIGIIHWVLFLNFGKMSFKADDWSKEFIYYSILRESIINRIIPYHISNIIPIQGTNRFLAIPEILLSPQIILLPLMSTGKFVLINTLLLYSLGFVGCLLIKKRYQLSLFAFSILYLLFNFNGYITSKFVIGGSLWNGYFLLPFFFLFTLELLEKKTSINTSIKLSLVLFAIILQGLFHIYICCIMFLLILAIFNREYLRQVLLIILFSSLLSLFRLFPAMITFYNYDPLIRFVAGYPTITDLLGALITIRQPNYYSLESLSFHGALYRGIGSINLPSTWDEYDAYLGIIGFAVIVYFGIYLRFSKNPNLKNYKYQALDMPILILVLLSLSYFYAFIVMLPVPFINIEINFPRFLIFPILTLLVISSVRMQQLLYTINKNAKLKFLAIAGIMQMFFSLAAHSFIYRVQNIDWYFRDNEPIASNIHIINQADKWYIISVKISTLISLVTLLMLVGFFFWRVLRKNERLKVREIL